MSLVLAGALMLLSVAAGVWLMVATPDADGGPSADNLQSNAQRSAYGGDAYTGIQNAAADTERAVVDGANMLADMTEDVYDDTASAEDARWSHLFTGLGFLLMVLGVGNFSLALQRSPTRRP